MAVEGVSYRPLALPARVLENRKGQGMSDNWIIKLSSAVRIDGLLCMCIGPFPTIDAAKRWAAENDDALNEQGVALVSVDYLQPPVTL